MSDTKLQEQVNEIKNRILRTESADWRNFAFTINQNLKDWQSSTAKEQLKASIKRGFLNTFNVWEDPETGNLECLDGKHRVDVLLELQNEGMSIPELLPTNFIECKDRKEAAKNVLIYSSFYAQITPIGIQEYSRINEIQIEKMPEINLPPMPIIEELEAIPIQHEAVEDDFDTTPPAVAKTVLGDLYEIGLHRVLCGDATCSDTVARLMNGEKADIVYTDPPYGLSYQSNMRTKTDKFEVLKNDEEFIAEWVNNIPLYSNGFVFVWTSWKVIKEWIEICSPIGELSNMIIWDKGGGGIGDLKKTFATDFEIALVYNRGSEITGKRLGSVWQINKDAASGYVHPTQKPVELAALAIENIIPINKICLDFFLGSGSTMVAAHQLKRKCFGCEISPQYCDVIVKRMLNLDSTLRVKRNGVDVTEEWRD